EQPAVLHLPVRTPQFVTLAHRGDRSRGEAPEPFEGSERRRPTDAIGRDARVALELTKRLFGLGSEDAVLATGVESESGQPLLEVGDVVAAQHRTPAIEQAVTELEAALDKSAPGLGSTDAVHAQTARGLERTDCRLGGRSVRSVDHDRLARDEEALLQVADG